MSLSHTFVLNLKLERLCLAKKILKDYTAFYDWFKKTQKKVVPVEVEGIPEELLQSDNTHEDVTEDKPKRTTPHKGSIMVTTSKKHGTGRTHRKYTQTEAS